MFRWIYCSDLQSMYKIELTKYCSVDGPNFIFFRNAVDFECIVRAFGRFSFVVNWCQWRTLVDRQTVVDPSSWIMTHFEQIRNKRYLHRKFTCKRVAFSTFSSLFYLYYGLNVNDESVKCATGDIIWWNWFSGIFYVFSGLLVSSLPEKYHIQNA